MYGTGLFTFGGIKERFDRSGPKLLARILHKHGRRRR